MTEKEKREKERLIEKESLAMTGEDLNEQESKARQELEAADELLNDATSKLQDALSSTTLSKNSVTVAKMMLETAKTVDKKTHDLLDQALPSEDVTQTKRKSEVEEKSVKKVKRKQLERRTI